MDNVYVGGEPGKWNGIMEFELEEESHRKPRWRKVTQNTYGRRLLLGLQLRFKFTKREQPSCLVLTEKGVLIP